MGATCQLPPNTGGPGKAGVERGILPTTRPFQKVWGWRGFTYPSIFRVQYETQPKVGAHKHALSLEVRGCPFRRWVAWGSPSVNSGFRGSHVGHPRPLPCMSSCF